MFWATSKKLIERARRKDLFANVVLLTFSIYVVYRNFWYKLYFIIDTGNQSLAKKYFWKSPPNSTE